MLKVFKKEGFASMIEVIVTSIIFIITTAGILTTISTFNAQSGGNVSKRLEAVYVGKQVIDSFRSQVDAGTWDSGNLELGIHSTTVSGYIINYLVEGVPSGCGSLVNQLQCIAKKMTMNIYYVD